MGNGQCYELLFMSGFFLVFLALKLMDY